MTSVQYHIVEIQNRADGINNVLPIETRNSKQTGLSYFYERCSKMAGTTLFPSVTVMLIDSEGTILDKKHLTTAWEPEAAAE